MAKDPAMLWYWADWNSGTTTLSRFLKGCYMDLLHAQFNNGHLSIDEIETVLGSDFPKAWPTLKKKFQLDKDGLFFNKRLDDEKAKRAAYTQTRRDARTKNDTDTVRVYFIRDSKTGFTKIGSSTNPERRLAELLHQKNPAIVVGDRDYELLWYSGPTERAIEKKIHTAYKSQKMKGEWFDLEEVDLRTITQMFFGMIYQPIVRTNEQPIEHTSEQRPLRTENVNENKNEVVFESKVGVTGKARFDYNFVEKPDKAVLTTAILNDELFVENLQLTHRGKDIAQAWGECWLHHTQPNAPPAPNDVGWWKQKLNGWLSNKKYENGTSKAQSGNRKQQHTSSLAKGVAETYRDVFKGGGNAKGE